MNIKINKVEEYQVVASSDDCPDEVLGSVKKDDVWYFSPTQTGYSLLRHDVFNSSTLQIIRECILKLNRRDGLPKDE